MQEFAANAVTALHLNELTEYVPNLRLWLLSLSGVLGLLCCFFGYKLHKLWFAAVCLVFGCLVGNYLFSQGILDINFSIAAGLLAATLFVFTYRLAAPEIGFSISQFLLVQWFGLELSTAIIPSILLAATALFLDRWIITISTALFGAYALVSLAPSLPLKWSFLSNPAPDDPVYYLSIGILAALGFLAQCSFGSRDPLISFRKK